MSFEEVQRVEDIQAGSIIKWVHDRWLDNPSIESLPKIWLCVAVDCGNGFWFYRINTDPNRGVDAKFSIRLDHKDYPEFLRNDCHIDCYLLLDRRESEIESNYKGRKLISTKIREDDIRKILDLIESSPDEFTRDISDPIRKQLMIG